MSEPAPPGVAEGVAGDDGQALTAAVDRALADFRAWLLARPPAEQEAAPSEPTSPALDVSAVLAQFVALRQEVNLQTRAVRGQQEQGGAALAALRDALDALEREREEDEEARGREEEARLRPLLKTLVELHDALSLAGREIQRVSGSVLPELEEVVAAAEGAGPGGQRPSFWARWFLSPSADAALRERLESEQQAREAQRRRQEQAEEAARRVRQALGALLAGYTMSLQRVERALRQHGLEPIPAAGRPFDPERMEVLEAVADAGRPDGEVIEEVRRGYLWNGRVFRFAQVRVSRQPAAENGQQVGEEPAQSTGEQA